LFSGAFKWDEEELGLCNCGCLALLERSKLNRPLRGASWYWSLQSPKPRLLRSSGCALHRFRGLGVSPTPAVFNEELFSCCGSGGSGRGGKAGGVVSTMVVFFESSNPTPLLSSRDPGRGGSGGGGGSGSAAVDCPCFFSCCCCSCSRRSCCCSRCGGGGGGGGGGEVLVEHAGLDGLSLLPSPTGFLRKTFNRANSGGSAEFAPAPAEESFCCCCLSHSLLSCSMVCSTASSSRVATCR